MKKNILILSVLVIFFTSFIPQKSYAAAPVLKVAAGSVGERLIIGMAEKAGVKMATKEAREKAVERWNLKVYEDIKKAESLGKEIEAENLRNMQKSFSNAQKADLVPAGTNGFSKAIISTTMFLTGADIIYDIYSDIKLAHDTGKMLEVMADVNRGIREGEYYTGLFGYSAYWGNPNPNNGVVWFTIVDPTYGPSGVRSAHESDGRSFYISFNNVRNWVVVTSIVNGEIRDHSYQVYPNSDSGKNSLSTKTVSPPDVSVPNKVNPLLDPLRDAGLTTIGATPVHIPEKYPETVEIIIPDSADYPEIVDVPWNEPFKEPEPDPVGDPDSGIDKGEQPDGKPGNSSWWEWLLSPLDKILELLRELFNWLKSIFSSIPEWFATLFNWLSRILDGILGIPQLILNGLETLFVPSDPIGDLLTPIGDVVKTKFNTPSDFAFLMPSIQNGGCPPNIELKGYDIAGSKFSNVVGDLSIACGESNWWKKIMSGFIWFLFGWWLFRKGNALMAKNGGIQ